MNPTRFFPNGQPLREKRGAQAVCEMSAVHTRRTPARQRGLLTAAALGALCCVALAGCDGSSNGGSSSGGASGGATAANNAAAGAGGASAAVPIVAAPASGACAALGASAVQPLQNTQLVCAP
ncbi:hypothetical protein [Paraburkholderia sp. BL21I4N1]|uniref:hypothetical protein n=1 Tax=Paraburkholderia sp. BL21I4N1 TaxID=1938801 RepID=UPI000D3F8EC6|nr:hypothetical protein [Paraburkholderia sp. BL21I4N1]PQV48600.1 hypothetical protein B0G83_108127 [Paraburkholderia sp. BL21I4N1]